MAYTAEDFKSLVSTSVEGFLCVTHLSIKQMLAQVPIRFVSALLSSEPIVTAFTFPGLFGTNSTPT